MISQRRRNTAIFFLGLLAGAMLVHLIHARRLEQLYREKESLKVQLFETTDKLTRMEELWADKREGGIGSVDFVITGEMEPFVELELQRQVREITSGLPGSLISEVQPHLLVSLLHQRKLTVEQRDYLVRVNWVVIAAGTLFNLSVSPAPEDG